MWLVLIPAYSAQFLSANWQCLILSSKSYFFNKLILEALSQSLSRSFSTNRSKQIAIKDYCRAYV